VTREHLRGTYPIKSGKRCAAVEREIEALGQDFEKPTVKQHLAGIRMLSDWLVTGQVVATNPAHAVRGPKHVVKTGKTIVLDVDQARTLLDSIDISTVIGLRDRALIALMTYSFARVSAAVAMDVEDYHPKGLVTLEGCVASAPDQLVASDDENAQLSQLQHIQRQPSSDHRQHPSDSAQRGLRYLEGRGHCLSLTSHRSAARPWPTNVTSPLQALCRLPKPVWLRLASL
jgi:site-specific recombinase XerC